TVLLGEEVRGRLDHAITFLRAWLRRCFLGSGRPALGRSRLLAFGVSGHRLRRFLPRRLLFARNRGGFPHRRRLGSRSGNRHPCRHRLLGSERSLGRAPFFSHGSPLLTSSAELSRSVGSGTARLTWSPLAG